MQTDEHQSPQNQANYASDEDHSVLEEDSDGDGDYLGEEDDDGSSSLSIPNESIDFDLVYSLHTFVATVEGQANVVKGDSLYLMDDSNSYWWLVRVLKTQEVGYIPAENIETPFERLARLNKHRNVDLASATQAELQEDIKSSRERMRNGITQNDASIKFNSETSVFYYPPAVWGDEIPEDDGWDEDEYETDEEMEAGPGQEGKDQTDMEPDDGMSWETPAAEQAQEKVAQAQPNTASTPAGLRPSQPQAALAQQQQGQPLTQAGLASQTATSNQAQLGLGIAPPLRQQPSHEGIASSSSQGEPKIQSQPLQASQQPQPTASGSARALADPEQATETMKLSATPSIAREEPRPIVQPQQQGGPLPPSAIMQQQQEAAKRAREEAAEEEAIRKRLAKGPTSQSARPAEGKLRKERSNERLEEEKPKKSGGGGVFSIFSRKSKGSKDKEKEKKRPGGGGISDSDYRNSEESVRQSQFDASPISSMSGASGSSPTFTPPQKFNGSPDSRPHLRNSTVEPRRAGPVAPIATISQYDQQQQQLYLQQYLKPSQATPPESLQPNHATPRPRPGSLIMSPTADGPVLPDLSVLRVFAGPHLQSEATFKTVLLNASTTSGDLVRQAMQRFRLAAGEDEADYYLTIKQVEGSSAVLLPDEKPLAVFEQLVEEAQSGLDVPRVKRSSVGSISSVSSNLSMHPAIRKLGMNDFTDDSAVKFYLNRKVAKGQSGMDDDDDEVYDHSRELEQDDPVMGTPRSGEKPALTVSPASGANVPRERFTSPTSRFPLQLIIYPSDLPDGMVFDPHTEAIVPRSTLRDRNQINAAASPGISQTHRRKVFVFPKNTTVAEVIELGLERFGIVEGVVDGGDEVEDKLAKRRSFSRVRYGLKIEVDGIERELHPSSKVLDAFPRPPSFRMAEQRRSGDGRRRSADATQLLGTSDDVHPDDPVFILRRSVGYRPTSTSSRNRTSAPLDDLALHQLHSLRDSTSEASVSGARGLITPPPEERAKAATAATLQPPSQMSTQELIAEQRAKKRANQKAILSSHQNSEQGVDVVLSNRATIRSIRLPQDDRVRYSYIEPDGETYDISEIIEEELNDGRDKKPDAAPVTKQADLLEGVLGRAGEGLTETIGRVLNKLRTGAMLSVAPALQVSTATTDSYGTSSRSITPSASPGKATLAPTHKKQQPSVASILSDVSPKPKAGQAAEPPAKRTPLVMKDDFGVSQMMAVIELGASIKKPPPPPEVSAADAMFFGTPFNVDTLHPRVRELFDGTFKQLDDLDHQLDQLLLSTLKPQPISGS